MLMRRCLGLSCCVWKSFEILGPGCSVWRLNNYLVRVGVSRTMLYPGGLVYTSRLRGWTYQCERRKGRVGSQTQVTIRLLRKSNHIVGNSIQWGRKPLRKKSNRCSIRRQDEMLVCDCDSDTLDAQLSSYAMILPGEHPTIIMKATSWLREVHLLANANCTVPGNIWSRLFNFEGQ